MSNPWTVTRARTILNVAAYEIQEAAKLLAEIHAGLPRPADLADRREHRKPYNAATDILATIECVLHDELLPAIQALQRSARVTDAELARDFLEHKRQWRL